MNLIINNEQSFGKMLRFIKKYFKNVRVVNNKNSHLASRSQNYFKIILFENRGCQFSVMWNYSNSKIYFGDISKGEKTSFQYTFTKMKLDRCYPIEEMNNYNVMFWEIELIDSHNDIGSAVSPLRLPVTVSSHEP